MPGLNENNGPEYDCDMSDVWRQANTDERILAMHLFNALRVKFPSAYVQGGPALAAETYVDGHFNLLEVASFILKQKKHALSEVQRFQE